MQIQTQEYKEFITIIKSKIQISQIKASIKVNEELLRLYWDIASMIVEKQKDASWGDKFLENLGNDLKKEFPNMKGFSKRNLELMRRWYLFYSNAKQVISQFKTDDKITKQAVLQNSQQIVDQNNTEIGQQLVAKLFLIPWGHNNLIVSKFNSSKKRLVDNNYLVVRVGTDK